LLKPTLALLWFSIAECQYYQQAQTINNHCVVKSTELSSRPVGKNNIADIQIKENNMPIDVKPGTIPVVNKSGNTSKTNTSTETTTTVVSESGNTSKASTANSMADSFNSSSADSHSRNSSSNDRVHIDGSRNSHNNDRHDMVFDGSFNRQIDRSITTDNSNNSRNVDKSDRSINIDKSDRRRIDKSTKIKIGRINVRNQEGLGHVLSGRDAVKKKNSKQSKSSNDDNSFKVWEEVTSNKEAQKPKKLKNKGLGLTQQPSEVWDF
jgi:hypothetical protein